MRLDIHSGFKNENNIMCITRSKQRGKNQNFLKKKITHKYLQDCSVFEKINFKTFQPLFREKQQDFPNLHIFPDFLEHSASECQSKQFFKKKIAEKTNRLHCDQRKFLPYVVQM